MALRVLLADESSTIKKVMQLALQDFGVEVKAVPIGLDVLQVASSFKPDIIFADILLAKRNGYEVCGDLKADPKLKHVPVVLMWSGFMELDEKKATSSKADARLEKPFDADSLRNLVKDLVPALSESKISSYLSFPELPPMVEDGKQAPAEQNSDLELVNLNDLDEPEEFQQVPLPKIPVTSEPAQKAGKTSFPLEGSDDWSHQDLSKFKIDLPKEDFNLEVDEADLTNTSVALSSGIEEIALDEIDSPAPTSKKKQSEPPSFSSTFGGSAATPSLSVDPVRAEQILREEVRGVIESIAWKVIPDIAERIVREEIQKLLKDAERI